MRLHLISIQRSMDEHHTKVENSTLPKHTFNSYKEWMHQNEFPKNRFGNGQLGQMKVNSL